MSESAGSVRGVDPAALEAAFQAAWTAYMGTRGSNHESMILSWRNAVEAAAEVIWAAAVAAPAVPEGRADGWAKCDCGRRCAWCGAGGAKFAPESAVDLSAYYIEDAPPVVAVPEAGQRPSLTEDPAPRQAADRATYLRGVADGRAEVANRSATDAPAGGEHCQDCGGPVGVVWHADDDLWARATQDGAAILCPRCFDHRADPALGKAYLVWVPTVTSGGGDWPTILTAPAVPVGVQPEPAEDGEPCVYCRCRYGHDEACAVALGTEPATPAVPVVHPSEETLKTGADFSTTVVHPEPGDRDETREQRRQRWVAALLDVPPHAVAPHTGTMAAIGMALADAEVAAAVAAAGADLGAKIEADTDPDPQWDGPEFAAGMRRAAAIVRGERS